MTNRRDAIDSAKSSRAEANSAEPLEGEVLDEEDSNQKLPRKWWESMLWFIFASDWRQFSFAFLLTLVIAIGKWFDVGSFYISPFKTYSELHSFVFGICSIVTLIASITFGFLIYSSQAVENEKRELYAHLRASVLEARKVLDPLIKEGVVGGNVSEKMHAFELIMPSDLPLRGDDWEVMAAEFFHEFEEKSPRLEEPARTETLRRLVTALFLAEESMRGFDVNDVRQAIITIILARPVYKSFACLGGFLLLVVVSAAFYSPIVAQAMFTVSIFLTLLAVAFIIEIILYAKRELYENLYRN